MRHLNILCFTALWWRTRNFLNVPINKKGAVSGTVMRHKQHILFLPKIDVFHPLVRIIVRLRWVTFRFAMCVGRHTVKQQWMADLGSPYRLRHWRHLLDFCCISWTVYCGLELQPVFLRKNGRHTTALISCWTQYIQLSTLTLQAQPGPDYSMRVNATILRAVAETTDTNEAAHCHARQPAPAQMDSQATAGTIC